MHSLQFKEKSQCYIQTEYTEKIILGENFTDLVCALIRGVTLLFLLYSMHIVLKDVNDNAISIFWFPNKKQVYHDSDWFCLGLIYDTTD